jgi:hypothetical protein
MRGALLRVFTTAYGVCALVIFSLMLVLAAALALVVPRLA